MAASDVQLLREAWAAFTSGDLDAATEVLHPQVRWHGADDDESGCHNRTEAVAFIRQALADGVTSELLDLRDAGDRVVLILHSHTPPEWGERRSRTVRW